ncbi:MAG: glycosyltransferase family 25 protein, partial [Hyphomicrobiales bacterium]|nr:glycosyltransferase family 25 protein [Hyphomicrobiales bacterium]
MINIPIYLINLDKDSDRLEFMDNQFRELGSSYERFAAIRGTQLPEALAPYFTDKSRRVVSQLTSGEIGCYASHLAIMKIVANGAQPGLIFEDDVRIKPEFPALIDEFLNAQLPYDILRISSPRKKRWIFIKANFSTGYKAVKYIRVPML